MKKNILAIITITTLIFSCKPKETITLPEYEVFIDTNKVKKRPIYNPSNNRLFDLLHTKLSVAFNWDKAHMYGKAELTLVPYFYPQTNLKLDAKGFSINKIELLEKENKTSLNYTYDSLVINIDLNKEYTRNDTLKIALDYIAKPNELKSGGSKAITSDKGLYFINPTGEDSTKPQQIWTQGETQASSCWFPTIDSPNERATNEIAITVQDKYKTLSNGLLTMQELNGDGTRTDYWEMNLPHAPYLVMMAIGEFEVVEDKWNEMDVDYWVEPEYKAYAKEIFGNTPEMLTFFSNKLGLTYPWQKYSQIVVRDYVSGAMENTTAVIHGEFLHQTHRELIDDNNEDIIAHELFHHWFGDLVTCESWANLPLNESFATYGEYLWNEYKYGKDKANHYLYNDLASYLQEAKSKQVDMVRFDYLHREEMFDAHSYQKGGRILHMLRNYVGDDAFFAALKKYLTDHKYTDVEMHELRIAFEDVTGEDLNWFFNQWFFSSGHPVLDINYNYNDSLKKQYVIIEQMQNLNTTPIFKLPFAIDVYTSTGRERHNIVLDKVKQTFEFNTNEKPFLVNVDADKMLLCEKVDNKDSISNWVALYNNATNYLDRYEAIKKLSKSNDHQAVNVITKALDDSYYNIVRITLKGIKKAVRLNEDNIKPKLFDLAISHKNSKVRGDAITTINRYFKEDELAEKTYIQALKDSSYYVIGKALKALAKVNEKEALNQAKSLENEKSSAILNSIASLYASYGNENNFSFYEKANKKVGSYDRFDFMASYAKYIKDQKEETVLKGLYILKDEALSDKIWWTRITAIKGLLDLKETYTNKLNIANMEFQELKVGDEKEMELRNTIKQATKVKDTIEIIILEVKQNEKNEILKEMLDVKE